MWQRVPFACNMAFAKKETKRHQAGGPASWRICCNFPCRQQRELHAVAMRMLLAAYLGRRPAAQHSHSAGWSAAGKQDW